MSKTFKVQSIEEREEAEGPVEAPYHRPMVSSSPPEPAPDISPASIAVVGNGPSAAEHPELIDQQDFVVRVNTWYKHFPGFCAGKRLDAWALWPPAWTSGLLQEQPGEYEIWLATPVRLRDVQVTGGMERHKCRVVHPVVYELLVRDLKLLRQRFGTSPNSFAGWPSSGLVALAMALTLKPREILIAGFDATTTTAPGWGDHVEDRPWLKVQGHDYVAEKRLISGLEKDGSWLNGKVQAKVRWERLRS